MSTHLNLSKHCRRSLLWASALLFAPLSHAEIKLERMGTFYSGLYEESACEIGAYDATTKRLFVSNGFDSTLFAFDITDPTKLGDPANFLGKLDPINDDNFPEKGAAEANVNSVAVFNGLVACAIQIGTDPGYIAFYDAAHLDSGMIGSVEIPAHPDALAFSHNGQYLVAAGEAEAKGDVDPDGTVSIIDFNGPASVATAAAATYVKRVANFTAFNGQEQYLRNKGIRIFQGNGALDTPKSASEDLEPEYVAISADDTKAYVTLQEANGIAIVDLAAGSVLDIAPLGWKDHNSGRPTLIKYELDVNTLPVLAQNENPDHPHYGENIHLGGFSGLYYDPNESVPGQDVYYAVPDRGPNDDAISKSVAVTVEAGAATANHPPQNLRPFYDPNYNARIVKLIVDGDGKVTLADQIMLHQSDGTPITGKGNIDGSDEVPVAYVDTIDNADYSANGRYFKELAYDPMGGDFEGVVRDENGNFWLCDENRPAIYQFDANGSMLHRYVPSGADVDSNSTYGEETLPAHYAMRRANRGFEGIAYDADKKRIYAWIQSPIENPGSSIRNHSDVIRIIEIDAADGSPIGEYIYLLQRNAESGVGNRVDKIGDACWAGKPGRFYVLERDSSSGDPTGQKYLFDIDLNYATNVLGMDESAKTFEQMTADDLHAAGIRTAFKNKILNLPSIGYTVSDKTEGVTLLPGGDLAIVNDNDFGTASAGISDTELIGRIHFSDNYKLDASNKDDAINIRNWPTLGMFMPDSIAGFTDGDGNQYYLTANEGDARAEDDGYLAWDEARVKDLTLDPTVFPDAATLQENENLGRLKTVVTDGDLDGDGDFDRIFSFGARSFTVWDVNGNLVWDSGDQFALKIAELQPDFFNVDDNKLDGRSDDKGCEPEGIATGVVNGVPYAFVGLERQSGIMVYNLANPQSPQFVQFLSHADFTKDLSTEAAGDLAPEGIHFVGADKSPNGKPMLIVANEVSGSVSLYMVDDSDDTGDTDHDGLSNKDEREVYHTDPTKADSDGDLIGDKDEIDAGLDPMTNNQQLIDYFNTRTDLLPDAYSLAQIKNLAYDDVLIRANDDGSHTVTLTLSGSDDLKAWSDLSLSADDVSIVDGKIVVKFDFSASDTAFVRFLTKQ